MGLIKNMERSGKRMLIRLLGLVTRAGPVSFESVRDAAFDSILVIRQHNQMGDMLLATPALRAIKEAHPEAKLGIISSTLNRDVLVGNPHVDHLFTYDKRDPLSHFRLVRDIRRRRYDLVLVLHTVSFSFTSVVLAVLSGARLRVGSTSKKIGDELSGSLFNLALPLPDQSTLARMNEAEHNLYPLAAVGMTTDDIAPVMVPTDDSVDWAIKYEREHWRSGFRLVVHPGAGKRQNIWPTERFARVVDGLGADGPMALTIVEGPRDQERVAEFQRTCATQGDVVRGRRIGDVAALMQKADLVICNDTGVMHVAASVGANTLAVFGPTDPNRWAPRSPGLTVMRADDGDLLSLGAEQVLERARELLVNVARTSRGGG